jgi:hypothetical protein
MRLFMPCSLGPSILEFLRGLVDRTWARTDIKPPIHSPQRPRRAPRAFMRAESGFAGISQKRTEIGTPGAISTPRQLAFTPAHHTARGGRCERCGNILFPGIGGPSLGSDSQQTTNLRSVLHSAHNAHRERLCGRSLGLQGLVRNGQRSETPDPSQDPKNSLSPPPTRQLAVGVVSAVEIFCFRGLLPQV